MIRSHRGAVLVLLVLLLPMCFVGVAIVADLALLVVTKMRLQTVVDRATHATGESLAESMNTLARQNREIHDHYLAQKREFARRQQESRRAGQRRAGQRRAVIDGVRRRMDDVVASGYARACRAGAAVVAREAPWAQLRPLGVWRDTRNVRDTDPCTDLRPLFSFHQDHVDPAQWQSLPFSYTEGGLGWDDPGRVGHDAETLLSHRQKARGPGQHVGLALRLESRLPRGTLGAVLDRWPVVADLRRDARLTAIAAAQPFGGSIAEFDDDYQATLVPIETWIEDLTEEADAQ